MFVSLSFSLSRFHFLFLAPASLHDCGSAQVKRTEEKVCHKQSTRGQAVAQQWYTLLQETSVEALDDENT